MRANDTVTTLRALHAGAKVLVLPNVWDAASTALFAAAGAKAIATTSAGLAWACGFADGDVLPRASLRFAVGSIVRVACGLPVTADIESGYANEPDAVAALVEELRELGIAGVNIEDGTANPELLAEKIAAVKRGLAANGGDVFINARTDVYLRGLASGDDALRETIARGRRYAAAGADGFFVPGLTDSETIRRIAADVALPLNLLAARGLAPARELYGFGARRLSAGASIARLAYAAARAAAAAFVRDGDGAALFTGAAIDYGETNELLHKAGTPGA